MFSCNNTDKYFNIIGTWEYTDGPNWEQWSFDPDYCYTITASDGSAYTGCYRISDNNIILMDKDYSISYRYLNNGASLDLIYEDENWTLIKR